MIPRTRIEVSFDATGGLPLSGHLQCIQRAARLGALISVNRRPETASTDVWRHIESLADVNSVAGKTQIKIGLLLSGGLDSSILLGH